MDFTSASHRGFNHLAELHLCHTHYGLRESHCNGIIYLQVLFKRNKSNKLSLPRCSEECASTREHTRPTLGPGITLRAPRRAAFPYSAPMSRGHGWHLRASHSKNKPAEALRKGTDGGRVAGQLRSRGRWVPPPRLAEAPRQPRPGPGLSRRPRPLPKAPKGRRDATARARAQSPRCRLVSLPQQLLPPSPASYKRGGRPRQGPPDRLSACGRGPPDLPASLRRGEARPGLARPGLAYCGGGTSAGRLHGFHPQAAAGAGALLQGEVSCLVPHSPLAARQGQGVGTPPSTSPARETWGAGAQRSAAGGEATTRGSAGPGAAAARGVAHGGTV